MKKTSSQVAIYFLALLWLKVTSFEFDCNKLLDVCPEETVQLYCRKDNEGSNTIIWVIRNSVPGKSCFTSFGVYDSYGTRRELDESCSGSAWLVSKVPISTILTLLVTPDLVNVTCSPDSNSAGEVCPIVFKGKPSPPVNVSYVKKRDDKVLVMWSSSEDSNYKIIVTSTQANESYNRTLDKNFVSLTIKKDLDYNITVVAFNCAGESLPSDPIIILSPPSVSVTMKYNNVTVTWNQTEDECFIIKIEDEQNLECGKKGSLNKKLMSHKLYEIELLSKPNGSLVTGSLWRKQYCIANSVSPQPRVRAQVLNDNTLEVNVTLRSHCDPGELLQDCLCPAPSEIILQLDGENKTHYDPTETNITIDLSYKSSGSGIVFGTVWVMNGCRMSEGVHFFVKLPVSHKKNPSTDGIGCTLPSLVLLLALLLLALLFV